MKAARSLLTLAGAFSALLATAPSSHAQLNRTAVSVAGSDANSCTVATPCRSIARAITQTNAGGEVIVLDSAGYGPFTVDRSVTVQAAPGVYAGVTATSGTAIQITAGATDKIVLRGLVVNGVGTASAGVAFTGGGAEVDIENCVIAGFANWGVLSFFPIRIQDTTIRDSGVGVQIDNAGAPVNATLEHVRLQHNTVDGVLSWRNASVTVRDSVAALNSIGFAAKQSGVLYIDHSMATNNTDGVMAAESGLAGTVRLSRSTIVDNSNAGVVVGGGVVETWGDNAIRGNGTPPNDVSGTLTPVLPI